MSNLFHIGQMRQTAIFKVNNPTAATTGGKYDNYTTLLTTRCKLRKKSGNRALEYAGIVDNETYEMICRFQSTLQASLRNDAIVIIGNQQFTISSWERINEIKSWYNFTLNLTRLTDA